MTHTAKLSMVIMSHLSDMQEEFIHSKKETNKINFIKWLIINHKDLTAEIDADTLWTEFTATPYYKP
jgi:hypothetical protein